MSKKFAFDLVSPEARLVSERVSMAVIPGDEGEFGVMAGHASLVASLKTGVVKLYTDEGKKPKSIFITGGFADIGTDHCTILAEEAVNVKDLSKKTLEQTLKDLNEDLGIAEEAADKKRINAKILDTQMRLDAIAAAA
ncbi:MAG: ATP synthase F1 subunit epsilon [Alphaproteobacteria bacterium]|nr:ATP synthase F1 subunit epsilon [Alphaproteobacteria bacterium]